MKPVLPGVPVSTEMEALLERLRADGDRIFGSRRIQLTTVSFERRESSDVARVRVATPTGPRSVFAKTVRPRTAAETVADAAVRLRHDAAVTRRVADALNATSDLRAVELLAVYEGPLGVVTREAPGIRLDAAIAEGAAWPARADALASLETTLDRLGRWMAMFQQVPAGELRSPLDPNGIRAYIDLRLAKLVALGRSGLHVRERAAILAHIDRQFAAVSDEALMDVAVHGDITPSNVMVTPERVTVLDFGMTARGSRYFDVSRMHSQLMFYTAKPQYRPAVIERLQRALLHGFEPGLTDDHPLFDIFAIQHVVCHLLSHARKPGGFPRSLYSRHLCRQHRRWLRQRCQVASARVPTAAVTLSPR